MPTRQNFYLWGSWGARVAHQPFLTQKLDEPVQKVCIRDRNDPRAREPSSISFGALIP